MRAIELTLLVYMLNVISLCVTTSSLKAFNFSPGSYPYASNAFLTTPYPPWGLHVRFNGLSDCIPTMISSSLDNKYPGACDVMVDGVVVSTDRTPPASRSSASSCLNLERAR